MNILAWQGLQLRTPRDWSPVRIEGNVCGGYLLIADMESPRLGIRWHSLSSRRSPADAVSRAMRDEVGQLASAEALRFAPPGEWSPARLYRESAPPGRDVWCAYSPASRRVLSIVYHAQQRDRVLAESILPTLFDCSPNASGAWSVFDLSCHTPAGFALLHNRLNAGDLSLTFTGPSRASLRVRQLAPATLALQRRPVESWMAEQVKWLGRHYRTGGNAKTEGELSSQQIVRRRRFALMWWLPNGGIILARHDRDRDRLVIVNATSPELAETALQSVGWAQRERH